MKRVTIIMVLVATALAPADSSKNELNLEARKRILVAEESVTVLGGAVVKKTTSFKGIPSTQLHKLDPARTAVVVCDMWDDHWCKSAATRCADLAKKAEPVLAACRKSGMTIIHCPSDTMPFYEDHPARKRMLAVKKVNPPKNKDLPNPPLPVDDSDGGCDDAQPAKQFKAWTRQNAAISIDEDKDYITDNGGEVFSLMAEKKLDTLIVMGVHTNMCVLNRTFAIKQMVKWGKSVFLVRDLTDAMYNPKMKPMVTHQKGTELIIEYIETYWCPTIESKQLMGK